jgi:hypothetical protein
VHGWGRYEESYFRCRSVFHCRIGRRGCTAGDRDPGGDSGPFQAAADDQHRLGEGGGACPGGVDGSDRRWRADGGQCGGAGRRPHSEGGGVWTIGGSAHLAFSLSSITLANGSRVAVHTTSYAREGRAHVKHNAEYIATAGVLGALAGQAVGHDRKTTEKGAAIGAGVGIGAAAATGKFDFEEKAGSRYRLKLRAAIRTTL